MTDKAKAPALIGWVKPGNSRKYHYFQEDGRSLCGNWGYFGRDPEAYENDKHEHSDNCAACQKKKLAQLEKEKTHD